jgi:PAS domain S-box-containing protein
VSLDQGLRRDLQLRAIHEIMRATAEALSLEEILSIIVNMVIIVLDAGTVWLMRLEDGVLRTRVARGDLARDVVRSIELPRAAVGRTATLAERPLILRPSDLDPSNALVGAFTDRNMTVVLVPLNAAGRLVGLLGFTTGPTESVDLTFPITLADQAAAAIATARIREESLAWRERLVAVFNRMAEAVLIFDAAGQLALFNRAAAALLGPGGVQTGDSIADVVDKLKVARPDGRPIEAEEMAASRVLRAQQEEASDEYIVTAEGRHLVIEARSVPLITGSRVGGAVEVWRDVTAAREAEEVRIRLLHQVESERAWLRTVIEYSPVGIILVEDPRGTRVVANRRAEQLFGRLLPPEGGIDQYIGQICDLDGRPLARSELATVRALNGETVSRKEEILRRADSESRVYVSAVPLIRGSRIGGAVVIYEDITRIRELERLREEWTSIIAHDLRQPVTVIGGYAGILDREVHRGTLPERVAGTVEHILTSAQSLNRMISDLLDVSRIESGRLQIRREEVDLLKLVRGVLERVAPVTRGHTVNLTVEQALPPVHCDPSRIEQVLTNLLSNAAKYGYPSSPIDVDVRRSGREIVVAVTNQGPGIPASELPRLFTRFFRARRAERGRVPGLGLGLFISRGIVESHGGRIWAESIPGQTTTFKFALPIG